MPEKEDAGVEKNGSEGTEQTTEVEKEESEASTDQEDTTDYKALYEKAESEKENYKKALTQKRQLRDKPEVEESEDEDDKPITRKDLANVLASTNVESKIEAELASIKDLDKRKLVKLYYDTRIRQTGTSDTAIKQDIEAALAIVDAPRLRTISSELSRKSNMQKVPPMNGSGADRGVEQKNHKFSDAQVKALTLKAQGLNADPTKFIEQAWKNQNRG